MKIKNLFVLGAMALAGVLTGCQSENKLDGTSLSIEPADVVSVSAEEQEIVVEVKADCEWVVKCDAEWIKLSTEGGKGNDKVTLFVGANTKSAREAVVHFQKSTTQKVSADLTVKQETGLDIKPGDGTVENPYLASQASEICAALEKNAVTPEKVYVKGYIKKFASNHETGITDFGNALFYITDDPEGTVTPDFYCYQVYYLEGTKFKSVDQLQLGDQVIVYGQLTHYYNETTGQEAYETVGKGAAYIYSHNDKIEADPEEIEDPAEVEQI
ncbi:MAG: BACON domain-containing protein, partial [Candidatus Cryptobacteroides sp.]